MREFLKWCGAFFVMFLISFIFFFISKLLGYKTIDDMGSFASGMFYCWFLINVNKL